MSSGDGEIKTRGQLKSIKRPFRFAGNCDQSTTLGARIELLLCPRSAAALQMLRRKKASTLQPIAQLTLQIFNETGKRRPPMTKCFHVLGGGEKCFCTNLPLRVVYRLHPIRENCTAADETSIDRTRRFISSGSSRSRSVGGTKQASHCVCVEWARR